MQALSESLQVVARVQAHPARSHLHQDLCAALAPLSVEIMVHESDPPSPWAGYKVCLSDLPDCSHLVVVQDDAVVCPNFGSAIEQVAQANPDTPVVLFLAHLPRRTARDAVRAMKVHQRYVDLFIRDFCPVVGMLWPKQKAAELLHWSSQYPNRLPGGEGARSDDAVVGRWMLQTRQRIRATVPSLVQHPDMEPSLIGRKLAWGKDRGRVAMFFAEDGLSYDWS